MEHENTNKRFEAPGSAHRFDTAGGSQVWGMLPGCPFKERNCYGISLRIGMLDLEELHV